MNREIKVIREGDELWKYRHIGEELEGDEGVADRRMTTIKVSTKTRDRLRAITYTTETCDDIINQLLNWAFDTIPEYHKRLQG